ncbi:hypothetical protein B484DRAFT_454928 [Ochromonadaceae sp. CCMP2298]|nr:hypothetical protein B484DRAFT_454928 [Ochromonadaceae sp. CCMP2298]
MFSKDLKDRTILFTHRKRPHLLQERFDMDFTITVRSVKLTTNAYFLANSTYIVYRKQNKKKRFTTLKKMTKVQETSIIPFNGIGTINFKVSLFRTIQHKYLGCFMDKEKVFVLRQMTDSQEHKIYVDLGQFIFPMHKWATLASGQDVALPLRDPFRNAVGTIFLTVEHAHQEKHIWLPQSMWWAEKVKIRDPLPENLLTKNSQMLEYIKQQRPIVHSRYETEDAEPDSPTEDRGAFNESFIVSKRDNTYHSNEHDKESDEFAGERGEKQGSRERRSRERRERMRGGSRGSESDVSEARSELEGGSDSDSDSDSSSSLQSNTFSGVEGVEDSEAQSRRMEEEEAREVAAAILAVESSEWRASDSDNSSLTFTMTCEPEPEPVIKVLVKHRSGGFNTSNHSLTSAPAQNGPGQYQYQQTQQPQPQYQYQQQQQQTQYPQPQYQYQYQYQQQQQSQYPTQLTQMQRQQAIDLEQEKSDKSLSLSMRSSSSSPLLGLNLHPPEASHNHSPLSPALSFHGIASSQGPQGAPPEGPQGGGQGGSQVPRKHLVPVRTDPRTAPKYARAQSISLSQPTYEQERPQSLLNMQSSHQSLSLSHSNSQSQSQAQAQARPQSFHSQSSAQSQPSLSPMRPQSLSHSQSTSLSPLSPDQAYPSYPAAPNIKYLRRTIEPNNRLSHLAQEQEQEQEQREEQSGGQGARPTGPGSSRLPADPTHFHMTPQQREQLKQQEGNSGKRPVQAQVVQGGARMVPPGARGMNPPGGMVPPGEGKRGMVPPLAGWGMVPPSMTAPSMTLYLTPPSMTPSMTSKGMAPPPAMAPPMTMGMIPPNGYAPVYRGVEGPLVQSMEVPQIKVLHKHVART